LSRAKFFIFEERILSCGTSGGIPTNTGDPRTSSGFVFTHFEPNAFRHFRIANSEPTNPSDKTSKQTGPNPMIYRFGPDRLIRNGGQDLAKDDKSFPNRFSPLWREPLRASLAI